MKKFNQEMWEQFDEKNLREMKYRFGFEVYQSKTEIFISQKKYVKEIL